MQHGIEPIEKQRGDPSESAWAPPPQEADTSAGEVIDASSLPSGVAETDYQELILKDPEDLIQRSLCVSFWYGDMYVLVDNLERHTGHQFGPVWKFRSPVEILEEQLSFWEDFMQKTEEIAKDSESTSEQTHRDESDK